jgi:hypothetical protein
LCSLTCGSALIDLIRGASGGASPPGSNGVGAALSVVGSAGLVRQRGKRAQAAADRVEGVGGEGRAGAAWEVRCHGRAEENVPGVPAMAGRSRTSVESMTSKPEVDFPAGQPPADLQTTDIWEGDGKIAGAGDTVRVHYVGVAYSTGEEFDASWDRGEPLEFPLGAGRVIAGWDQGVQA